MHAGAKAAMHNTAAIHLVFIGQQHSAAKRLTCQDNFKAARPRNRAGTIGKNKCVCACQMLKFMG